MSEITKLKPANRHLLIVPHFEKKETNSGVLLPEDYTLDQDRYIEAHVIDIAEDCDKQFRHLRYSNLDNNRIVIDRSMIQEVKVKEKSHYMILENYVLGTYRRPNED